MIKEEASTEMIVSVHSAITEAGKKFSQSIPLFHGSLTGLLPSQIKDEIMEQIKKDGTISNNDVLKAIREDLNSMVCEVTRKSGPVIRVKPGLAGRLLEIMEQHEEKKEDDNLLLMEPLPGNIS